MSETTRWWWIRHAPVHSEGRIYGNTDLPCDCSNTQVFANLAAALPSDPIWVITNLQRTRLTAEAIWAASTDNQAASTLPIVEPDLAEQDFGDWQGMTPEEVERERGDTWHRFWLAPAHEVAPNGESFLQVMARASGAIQRLSTAHAGRDIVAVTHGGTIRAALGLALGLDPERALAFSIENCSLTRIDHIAGPASSHQASENDDAAGGVLGEDHVTWRVSQVNIPPESPIKLPETAYGFGRRR